jgi:hypothetical protein
VISEHDEWLVAGEGSVHWFAPGLPEPVVVQAGEHLRL